MSDLYEDIARGCLENGEALEARWGSGFWSQQSEQIPDPGYYERPCRNCGKDAVYFGYDGADDELVKCEFCGIGD